MPEVAGRLVNFFSSSLSLEKLVPEHKFDILLLFHDLVCVRSEYFLISI